TLSVSTITRSLPKSAGLDVTTGIPVSAVNGSRNAVLTPSSCAPPAPLNVMLDGRLSWAKPGLVAPAMAVPSANEPNVLRVIRIASSLLRYRTQRLLRKPAAVKMPGRIQHICALLVNGLYLFFSPMELECHVTSKRSRMSGNL